MSMKPINYYKNQIMKTMDKDTILILSSNYKLKANKQLSEEVKKEGYKPLILDPLKLQLYLSSRNKWDLVYDVYGQKPERIYTGNIKAIIPRIGKGLKYGTFVLEQINKNIGIYSVQTAKALLNASNKMRTLQLCSKAGIKVPKTIFVKDKINIDFVISKLGLPFVCKIPIGSQGKGVFIIDTKRSAISVLDATLKQRQSLILQEFIGDGTDMRAIVVGNEVVASQIRRSTDKNDFRSNLSLSGKANKVKMEQTEMEFCIEASKAIGLPISGVDIMFNDEGEMFLTEINGNFGWKIQRITGVNIAKKIVQYAVYNSDIKDQSFYTDTEFKVFKDSRYLKDAFFRTKGKELSYTNRDGNRESVEVSDISDLYNIIEQTIIIE